MNKLNYPVQRLAEISLVTYDLDAMRDLWSIRVTMKVYDRASRPD
jgi:hypothetical protein